jgi:threonine dehydrogenase-like Zn-dependent dehydrogenase
MIALVKYGTRPGEVELREAPLPEIGPNDVLLRTAACGVCGSDLEMYHHQATYVIDVPVTLGHEFSGTVVEVGDAVRDWQLAAGRSCGQRNGRPYLRPLRHVSGRPVQPMP